MFAVDAELLERMKREISASLHVIDAGAEGAVAFDPERQSFDESEGMHGVEMTQDQDSGAVLSP